MYSVRKSKYAVFLLKELMRLMRSGEGKGGGVEREIRSKGEVSLGMEDLVPEGKGSLALTRWENLKIITLINYGSIIDIRVRPPNALYS